MPTGTERPGDDDMASRPVRHARIIAASVRSIPPSWRGDGLELLILHWLEELRSGYRRSHRRALATSFKSRYRKCLGTRLKERIDEGVPLGWVAQELGAA